MKRLLNELRVPIVADTIIYVIQFLIVPVIYSTSGNEGNAVLLLSTLLVTAVGMLFFSCKLRFWLPSIIVYGALMFIYTPPGAYGIGMRGLFIREYRPSERWFGITILFVYAILIQVAFWCVLKFFRYLQNPPNRTH